MTFLPEFQTTQNAQPYAVLLWSCNHMKIRVPVYGSHVLRSFRRESNTICTALLADVTIGQFCCCSSCTTWRTVTCLTL